MKPPDASKWLTAVIRSRTVATVFFSLMAVATGRAQSPANQIVDSGESWGKTGQYASHAVVSGNPAVSYYNLTDGDLMFARNSAADGSGTWTITRVDDGIVDAGRYCSLAVVDGNPAISYYEATNGNLKFARNSAADGSGTWLISNVNTSGNVGQYTSLAVVGGFPSISYYDVTNGNLKFTQNNAVDGSGLWFLQTVDSSANDVGTHTSLAQVSGNPAISYVDETTGDLKFARNSAADGSGTWTITFVDNAAGRAGLHSSLAVIFTFPAISYYDETLGDLKFARNSATDGSGTWTITTVDSSGDVGENTTLAVVSNTPAISYWDETNSAFKLARNSNVSGTGTWTLTTVVDVTDDSSSFVGWFNSLAVVNGTPAICYYDEVEGDLMFARSSVATGNNTWAVKVADVGVSLSSTGLHTSQALVAGNPAIAYFDEDAGKLKFMRATNISGTAWGAPVTVETSNNRVGRECKLAVVGANPAIVYFDETIRALKFARNTAADGSGAWVVSTVVGSFGLLYEAVSLLVISGNPAVAYSDAGVLKFARNSAADGSGSWTITSVDSSNTANHEPSLAVVNGTPAISYYDGLNRNLKFALNSAADGSGTWTSITVDSQDDVGSDSFLAVVGGNPAICYNAIAANGVYWVKYVRNSSPGIAGTWTNSFVQSLPNGPSAPPTLKIVDGKPVIVYTQNGDLKWARNGLADGTAGWTHTLVDDSTDAAYTSLLVVNGNPAISYFDSTNGNLKYARNSAADGQGTWTFSVLDNGVSNEGDTGQFTSLAVVSGNPAISYHDETNRVLKFARNSAANGTGTWSVSTVDMAPYAGFYSSLAVINGNPAISYESAGGLNFARNSAADGSGTWTITTVEDTGNLVQGFTSLAVVNGNPAISYYDDANQDLKFARNSNASGTGTWTTTTVDSTGSVGQSTSLAIVNGNPAISYYDVTTANLKFARNSNASGTGTWTTTTVDSTGSVGQYTSLAVINGTPAISYYDSSNSSLKFARNSAADGSGTWTLITVDSSAGDVGQHTSLAVIGANPGISYYDRINTDLKFAHASSVDGSGAWTITTLDNTSDSIGRHSSLRLINGYAAISYYDEGRGDLKYTVVPAPEIGIEQPAATNLADGGSKSLGTAVVGGESFLTFTVKNTGSANLTGLTHTIDGAHASNFSVSAAPVTPVTFPSGSTTFVIRFSPTAGGTRTAAIHLANNDFTENPFDINLTGTALSFTNDADGDGLNDAAEFQMSALGFDPAVSQAALVSTLYNSANGAGLYTTSQVQALNAPAPLIQRNPNTGVFTLTIGVEKSTTLAPGSFTPFPMSAPQTTINGAGKLEFQFTVPDNAAFFRLQAQ